MQDAELLRLALEGDTQAFGRLVVSHAPSVLRFVGGLASLPAGEREEIVQEAFVRAYEKLDQFDPERSFPAWVGGFARLVLCEHLARVKRHEEARRKLVAAAAAEAGLRRAREWPDPKAGRRLDALEECVDALPDPLRRVLHQHYREGVPLAVLAQALDRPLGTVKSLLHRSRLEVRNCMDRKIAEFSS
jgi:RNA polymerase sigma-70 factor (ECF subfamily)